MVSDARSAVTDKNAASDYCRAAKHTTAPPSPWCALSLKNYSPSAPLYLLYKMSQAPIFANWILDYLPVVLDSNLI